MFVQVEIVAVLRHDRCKDSLDSLLSRILGRFNDGGQMRRRSMHKLAEEIESQSPMLGSDVPEEGK